MGGFRVVSYNILAGRIGANYPEAASLPPIWPYTEGSKTPAAKAIPARMERQATS
jgi:hypothetical protein